MKELDSIYDCLHSDMLHQLKSLVTSVTVLYLDVL